MNEVLTSILPASEAKPITDDEIRERERIRSEIDALIRNARLKSEVDRELRSFCTGVNVIEAKNKEIFNIMPGEY